MTQQLSTKDSIVYLIENTTEGMMKRIHEEVDPMSEDALMDAWCDIQHDEIYYTVSTCYKGETRMAVEEYGLLKAISNHEGSLPSLNTKDEQDAFYTTLLYRILCHECDITWDSYWTYRESQ